MCVLRHTVTPSLRVPAPAHPRPLGSPALGHTHFNDLQYFHLQGPNLCFSCRKHVTAPGQGVVLDIHWASTGKPAEVAALAAQPGRAKLRRSHLAALQRPALVPRTASPRATSGSTAQARAQPSSSPGTGELLSLPAPARAPQGSAAGPHSTAQGRASWMLLDFDGSITHRDAPAATGRTGTAALGRRQRSQKSRAAERDLQSKFKQKSSRVKVALLPTHHFQVTMRHLADQS